MSVDSVAEALLCRWLKIVCTPSRLDDGSKEVDLADRRVMVMNLLVLASWLSQLVYEAAFFGRLRLKDGVKSWLPSAGVALDGVKKDGGIRKSSTGSGRP